MTKPQKLTDREIHDSITKLDRWDLKDDKLYKAFEFGDFVEAFSVMTRIALLAEKMNHHPEWFNVYKKLEISLTTHDVDGISNLDVEMAQKIDELVGS